LDTNGTFLARRMAAEGKDLSAISEMQEHVVAIPDRLGRPDQERIEYFFCMAIAGRRHSVRYI
jgi:hypothetical protein